MRNKFQLLNTILIGFVVIVFVLALLASNYPAKAQGQMPPTPQPTLAPTFSPEPTDQANQKPDVSRLRHSSPSTTPSLVILDDKNPDRVIFQVQALKGLKATSVFQVDYLGPGQTDQFGNSCITFPSDARTAIEFATTIWASTVNSKVPITARACWSDKLKANVKGVSGGQPYTRDFDSFPESGTWYPAALADALEGANINLTEYDFHMTFNSTFSWYFGTDGNPGLTQHDLVTTAAHEIGHGLGFTGSARAYESAIPGVFKGQWGRIDDFTGDWYPDIYDRFMEDSSGKDLIDYDTPSYELADLLRSDNLWWNGPNAKEANGDSLVKMYAPVDWNGGSSYVHLDYSTFLGSKINELMLYATGAGQVFHQVGPVARGILLDIGWESTKPPSPTLISPESIIYTRTPTYKWSPVTDASKYQFQLFTGSSKVLDKPIGCTTNPCIYKPSGVTLDYRIYKWRVKSYVFGKWSDYSNFMEFSVIVQPPTALTPNNASSERKPVYRWKGVSGASNYELQVLKGSTPVLDIVITSSSSCIGTTCKTAPDFLLNYGSYTWWIKAQKDNQWSQFSPPVSFSVFVPIPILKNPSGNLYIKRPTFTWTPYQYASDYQLQVFQGTATTPKINKTVTKSVCTTTLCSYPLTSDLPYADYTWKLRTKAEGVWSEWSGSKSFKVNGPPTPNSPSGNTYTREPTYKWSIVSGATQYKFQVYKGTTLVDEQTVGSAWCSSSSCEYKPTSKVLDYAAHTWKVQAYAAGAWRTYSTTKAFTVINPVPTPKSPTGSVYDNTPTYTWSKITGATQYRFEVYEGTGTTPFYTKTITSPTCDTTTCSNTPADLLSFTKQYKWRIQSYAGGTWQAYSAYLTFWPHTDTPILQSPKGDIYTQHPTLTWVEVFLADSYEIDISGIPVITVPSSVCSGDICSKYLSSALEYGEYTWKARAVIDGVSKPWSSSMSFTVINPVPEPKGPSGFVYADKPFFTWTEVKGASTYAIELYYSGSALYDILHVSAPDCSNGICQYRLSTDLYGAYHDWRWHIQAYVGGNGYPFSDYKNFEYYWLHSGSTVKASLSKYGNQRTGFSLYPSISGDGKYIAFMAEDDMDGEFINGYPDVFVHDLETGLTTQVSISSSGEVGYDVSYRPSISGNGRFVAFVSMVDSLVEGDTNGTGDVFVHDMQTGATTRVSVNSSGVEANGSSDNPSISSDGRFVAFWSYATNLAAGDTDFNKDIYVHDRLTGVTELISVSTTGIKSDLDCKPPSISADGRYVVFSSNSTTLVDGDTNGLWDIFKYDRTTDEMTRVSVAADGSQSTGDSSSPTISADGRYVAFLSGASNLVPVDTNGYYDVFLKDTFTGVVTRVTDYKGVQANFDSYSPVISTDGGTIVFTSHASNLTEVGIDTNGTKDVFTYKVATGLITLVSKSSAGIIGNYYADGIPALSADGSFIVFTSYADNLGEGEDTNPDCDVFLHIQ